MPTTRRAIALYGVLALAAAAVIVLGLNSIYGFLNSSPSASGSQRTATVTRGIVQSSVSASGNVGVARSASVGFAESGTLTALDVGVGSRVKVGQVIAKIDPTSARNTLTSAEANLAQAESTLATAKSGLTAAQQASNALSLMQGSSTITSDEQQLASDETTLATAKAQLTADTSLSCPALSSSSSSGSTASGSSATTAAGSSSAAGGSSGAGSSAGGTGSGSAGASGSSGSAGAVGSSKSSGASSTGASGTAGGGSSGSPGTGSAGSSSAGSSSTGSSSTGSSSTGSSSTGSSSTGSPSTGSSGSTPGGAAAASGAGSPGAGGSQSAGVRNGAAIVERAAVAPAVTTGSASAVSASSATLGGSVTPESLDTTYVFDYGTTPTALTSTSQSFDAGPGAGPVPVSVVVSGLHASQSYYFELVATNASGPTTGDLGLFTTSAAPVVTTPSTTPVVTTGQASSIGATSATLAGTVVPQGLDTSYDFVYGASPSSLGSTTTVVDAGSGSAQVSASAPLTGLKPGETYYFALVATNSSGSTTGSTQVFTTGTLALATTGQAASIGATDATLAGSVTPGGLDTTYHFVYGTSATTLSGATPVLDAGSATTGSVPVSVPLNGLKPGTTYYFALVASNASGSTTGSPQAFTTGALALATTGQAASIGATGVTLSGSVTPGGLATTYHFVYGTSATALTGTTPKLDAGSAATGSVPVSVALSGLKPGTTYYFALVATNASGTTSGALALFSTATLSVATTGQASSVGSTTVTLGGTVSPGGLPTRYWFEYGSSATALSSKTGQFAAGSGSDTVPVSVALSRLKVSTTYFFRLVAANGAGSVRRSPGALHHGRAVCERDDRSRLRRRLDDGDVRRQRRSRRPGGDLPLRVRNLRFPARRVDLDERRWLRLGLRLRQRDRRRPQVRHDLRLPPRRDERVGDE